jgi:hypothetical protein
MEWVSEQYYSPVTYWCQPATKIPMIMKNRRAFRSHHEPGIMIARI